MVWKRKPHSAACARQSPRSTMEPAWIYPPKLPRVAGVAEAAAAHRGRMVRCGGNRREPRFAQRFGARR
jgi:hypothetical protein